MDHLPGFRDFYPDPLPNPEQWSAADRQHIFQSWRDAARRYGFQEYDGPPLEPLELYTTKSGEEIVGQLYSFVDKGNRTVALRPEMTPSLARMVAAHARNYKKPVKWFALPQLFRYERQQKGRLREHFQFNADIIGETDAAADSELLCLLIDALRAFGLGSEDFVVRLSSRDAWREFYLQKHGHEKEAYAFYQAVDKLERDPIEQSRAKLEAVGFSLEEVRDFILAAQPTDRLRRILENIKARDLDGYVEVDYGVIRGLAYYTGVVFEAFDRKGTFRAIAGGGRYDNLIHLVSGGKVDLPALGFGMGDVVLLELLKQRGLLAKHRTGLNVFCLIEDETLRADSLRFVQKLREAGSAVDYSLTPAKPDKQFKRALELNAAHAVRLQRNQDGSVSVVLKNLGDRSERMLSLEAAADWLRPKPSVVS
jgi:histidyl-tRNA synthetase